MNNRVRGALASLVLGAGMVAATVMAQDKATLATDKDKVSYAIGLDVARSFQPIARDIDFAAMEKALANAMAGGKPLQSEEDAQATHASKLTLAPCRQRLSPRSRSAPAMRAQGLPAFEAACAGALLHSLAGDAAAREGQRGLLPSDLLPWLRRLANPEA